MVVALPAGRATVSPALTSNSPMSRTRSSGVAIWSAPASDIEGSWHLTAGAARVQPTWTRTERPSATSTRMSDSRRGRAPMAATCSALMPRASVE